MKCRSTGWPSLSLRVALLPCLALVACPVPLLRAAETGPRPGVERLIEDLGSEDFEVREAATRAMMDLDDAPPGLRRALASPDPEVRRRAADILAGIERKRPLRGLARAQALARDGRITEAVDRVVAFAAHDGQGAGGEAITRFVGTLLAQRECEILRRPLRALGHFPAGDFRSYVETVHPNEISGGKLDLRERGAVYARGEEVSFGPEYMFSIVAASGSVRTPLAGLSVIVAGGDVTVECVGSAVIVCDGDVEVRKGPCGDCLILARGKIRATCPLLRCVFRSENYLLNADGKKPVLKEGTPDPFAFVKFFELSDVGLTVAERDGQGEAVRDGVCIQEVRKGTMFSSTLQAGDIVTAIDGTKATSKEDFRKLLRKRLARGGPRITFTVRRAGKTSEIAVPVKD
jgi:hypothetical protein